MSDLSNDQFPETKIEPYFTKGGQGKFFRDPKPVAEHRYPRGYTPERMAEVRAAPLDISIMPKQTQASTVKSPSGARGVRRVQQMIARGTTPMSDFDVRAGGQGYEREPLKIKFGRKLPGRAGGWYQTRNVLKRQKINEGTPHEMTVHRQKTEREIHIAGDPGAMISEVGRPSTASTPYYPAVRHEEIGRTLHHELGHFRSQEVSGFFSGYSSPSQRGREEAYADVNMLSRARSDPRNLRRGSTGAPHLSYETKSNPFFAASYMKTRKELGEPLGIPHDIVHQRFLASVTAKTRQQRAEQAATNLSNDQFFHRDYTEEGRTGKPAWVTNPKHLSGGNLPEGGNQ